MNLPAPKLSVGLPVYNGENYLPKALDTLLAQTFTDFEIIISDNGSTDRTAEICRDYAARDERIRLYREEHNRGAAWNFNRVFELARGAFFKWASHDDYLAPRFLERCLTALEAEPDAVLAFCYAEIIDANEQKIETYPVRLNTSSPNPLTRFFDLLMEWHLCMDIFGVIRREALQKTPLLGYYAHGDGILLERLALMGRFITIPEILFYSRKHADQSMNLYGVYRKGHNDYHSYTLWFDPSKAGRIVLPTWRMLAERVSTLDRAGITPPQRALGYAFLLRWAIRQRMPLVYDLIVAARRLLQKTTPTPGFPSRIPDENRIHQSTH